MKLSILLVPALVPGAVLGPPQASRADWYQDGSYWVSRIVRQSPPASGTAKSAQAYSNGGACNAQSDGANDAWIAAEFGVHYLYRYPPYPPPHNSRYACASLTGSAEGYGIAYAGYAFSPYVSISRNTVDDDNPFDIFESHGPYDLDYGYAYIIASAEADGGGEDTHTEADSFVYLVVGQFELAARLKWCEVSPTSGHNLK